MWLGNLWNSIVRGVWNSLEMQDGEASECCKQSLMGNSGGSSKNQNVGRNADCRDYAHELSEGNRDSTGNQTRGHSCYILAKGCLYFVHVLKLTKHLNLKVMD